MRALRASIEEHLIQLVAARPDLREALLRDPRDFLARNLRLQVPPHVDVSVVQETADHLFVVLPHALELGAELSDSDLEQIAGGHTTVKDADCGGDGVFQTANSFEADIGAITSGTPETAAVAPAPAAPLHAASGRPGRP